MKKLFESKKFAVVVVIFNIALLLYMGIYLVSNKAVIFHKGNDMEVNTLAEQDNYISTDDTDDILAGSWAKLLANYKFTLTDGKVFSFGGDSSFSGYFNEEHKNVEGYIYRVENLNGNFYLSICDPKEESKVSYKMDITSEGDFEINNVVTGETYVLRY